MSSNVSPCGRYEYTGETKEVDGVTVKRYKVRESANPSTLPYATAPGCEMGFIDDWQAVKHGGAVCSDGVAIKSTLYDNAVVWGRVEHSTLEDRALVALDAHVLRCKLGGVSMVLSGAQVTDVTMHGDSTVRDGAIVTGDYCDMALSSIDVPSDAEILGNYHLLTLVVTTTSQLGTLVYRKKGGGANVVMGCWRGTIDELEELFMRDHWVETSGRDCKRLRPAMLAMVAFFRQVTADW